MKLIFRAFIAMLICSVIYVASSGAYAFTTQTTPLIQASAAVTYTFDATAQAQDEQDANYIALRDAFAIELERLVAGELTTPQISVTTDEISVNDTTLAHAWHVAVRENPYVSLIRSEVAPETFSQANGVISVNMCVQADMLNADGTIDGVRLATEIAYVDAQVADLIGAIDADNSIAALSDAINARIIYDTNVDPDADAVGYTADCDAYNVLASGVGVCAGYANVAKIAFNTLGYNARIVCGYLNGVYHEVVYVDAADGTYLVDATNAYTVLL